MNKLFKIFTKSFKSSAVSCFCSEVNLGHILEPHYLNGMNNYSSRENKQLIEKLMQEHQIESPQRIKNWINRRKRKDKNEKPHMVSSTKSCTVKQAEVSHHSNSIEQPSMKHPSEVTILNYTAWERYLETCPLGDSKWLLDGIHNGFSLETSPVDLQSATRNLASSYEQPEVIQDYFNEEINHGTMCGPFLHPPFQNSHINRFGVIPKASGKWRMITDLSYPVGKSVNDGVSYENYTVSYVGLSAAVEKILQLGRGCLLAKFDIQRAYRLLPVKVGERHLLVMKWNNVYYVDLALPFGARSAPRIFTRFSNVLEWIFQEHGLVEYIQHSLDDFFICGPAGTTVCQSALETCFSLCEELGVPIEQSKTEGPATQIKFLGFEIDSSLMEIRIPNDKLIKIRNMLELWTFKRAGNKRELLSLLGSLFYCCQAVTIGRPFLKRLVEKAHSVERLHEKLTLTEKECEDLNWWFYLLNSWNGRSMLKNVHNDSTLVKLQS